MKLSPVETWTAQKTGLGEKLCPQSLEAWQMAKIRDAVSYVREHSPFYAAKLSGIEVAALKRYADMQRLPFTRQEDVADSPESLLCVPDSAVARISTLTTSGRTGIAARPKRIFFCDEDIERSIDFFGLGMTTLIERGQHVSIMMSNATENSVADLLKKGIERYDGSAEIHGHVQSVEAAAASAARADCVVGVPSEILRLCRSRPELRPRSLLLSADFVPETAILAIASAWGCKIYTHYGMTETGYGCAVQCGVKKSCHLRHADMLLEIVNPETGKRQPDGEDGEVVVTTFAHRAMPLIRYRTGDIAHMDVSPCPCGGILPRLSKVLGRFCNITSIDGTEVRIEALDELIYAIPEVLGYRAEITRPRERNILSLVIDTTGRITKEQIASRLQPYLQNAADLSIHFKKLPSSIGRAKRRIHAE